jgi:hypothetical protein
MALTTCPRWRRPVGEGANRVKEIREVIHREIRRSGRMFSQPEQARRLGPISFSLISLISL